MNKKKQEIVDQIDIALGMSQGNVLLTNVLTRVKSLTIAKKELDAGLYTKKRTQRYKDILCTKPIAPIYESGTEASKVRGRNRSSIFDAIREGIKYKKYYWNYVDYPQNLVENRKKYNKGRA